MVKAKDSKSREIILGTHSFDLSGYVNQENVAMKIPLIKPAIPDTTMSFLLTIMAGELGD